MTIPTREQLRCLPTIRFPAGNGIHYSQDFCFYKEIPSAVEWYIAGSNGGNVSLVREGYGIKENYGDGSLLVDAKNLAFPIGNRD